MNKTEKVAKLSFGILYLQKQLFLRSDIDLFLNIDNYFFYTSVYIYYCPSVFIRFSCSIVAIYYRYIYHHLVYVSSYHVAPTIHLHGEKTDIPMYRRSLARR